MAPAQVIEEKDLPPELLMAALSPAVELGTRDSVAPADQPAFLATPHTAAASAPLETGGVSASLPASIDAGSWLRGLEEQARGLLQSSEPEVWDTLTRQFEACLIQTALGLTRGRRIGAAQKLGIGRNTITRKIQELGLPD
jgi:two-component system nitrogen regulation response regulator GlnG